jgi:hypothetical protein
MAEFYKNGGVTVFEKTAENTLELIDENIAPILG